MLKCFTKVFSATVEARNTGNQLQPVFPHFLVIVSAGDYLLAIGPEQNGLYCVSIFRGEFQLVGRTHMLKLCDIRARNIDLWCVGLNNVVQDKRSHAKVVVLHPNVLKVTSGENQCAEVITDLLQ